MFGMTPWDKASPAFRRAVAAKLDELFGKPDGPVLVLVSGGLDSMLLTEALHAAGYPLHLVHVNYGLRGAESDGDEALVRQWAEAAACSILVVSAPANFGSSSDLQSRARELRYGAAKKLAEELGATAIATAHHADDAIETFLLFAARGTGIDGLISLAESQGILRRPFLEFHKSELRQEAIRIGLKWRDDASNEGDRYTRNHLRHHALPALEQAIPQARDGIRTTMRRLRQLQRFAEVAIQRESSLYTALSRQLPGARVLYREALAHPHSEIIVYQLLKSYAPFELEALRQLAASQVGAYLEREGWRVWADREGLLLLPISNFVFGETPAGETVTLPLWDGKIWHQRVEVSRQSVQGRPASMGSALEPLSCTLPEGAVWRLWQEADFIQPLGLSGRKKVSDALTQAKVPSPVRREVVVLALDSGPGEVLWIPGIRLSQTIALALDSDNALRWTLNYL